MVKERVVLNIEKELKKEFKKAVIENDTTITEVLTNYIIEYINNTYK